ncbi:phosphatidylethanolamine-binding protein [Lactarius quietus]|nr:phosphatidylethanolamine-binding protein [Lactarius quietus]
MFSALILWIFLLSGILVKGERSCPGDKSIAEVHHKFEKYNVDFRRHHLPFDPVVLFELTFPELDAPPIHITASLQITPNQASKPPCFALCDSRRAVGHGPFVVAAVDPDAVPAVAAEVRHFLGGDFYLEPGYQGAHELVNKTPAISDFLTPAPPVGSGLHRYIFLLFKEPPSFKHQTLVNSSTSRFQFNLSAFVEATGLGAPLGGTFFLAGAEPTT